jgi:hypothetical protein
MKPTSLTKLAAVSAIALGAALYAGTSQAVDVIGVPQTITVGGTVENDLVATATAGVVKFSATGNAADLAAGTLNPDGTFVGHPGTGINSAHPASLVFDSGVGAQTAPQLKLVHGGGNFSTENLFISVDPTAGSVVDMTCGGTIKITGITDDSDTFAGTQMVWVKPVGGAASQTAVGSRPVDNTAGGNVIKFGVTLSTNTGTTASSYTSGACGGGTFNIVVDY